MPPAPSLNPASSSERWGHALQDPWGSWGRSKPRGRCQDRCGCPPHKRGFSLDIMTDTRLVQDRDSAPEPIRVTCLCNKVGKNKLSPCWAIMNTNYSQLGNVLFSRQKIRNGRNSLSRRPFPPTRRSLAHVHRLPFRLNGQTCLTFSGHVL